MGHIKFQRHVKAGPLSSGSEPAYVGPLDLVPGAVLAYSFRAMTAGSTANAIRLRESGGSTESNFALVSNVVSQAEVATFLGANDGFVSVWFDQGGNERDLHSDGQAEIEPLYAITGGLQGFQGVDSGTLLVTDQTITLDGGGITLFAVLSSALTTNPNIMNCGSEGGGFSACYVESGVFISPDFQRDSDQVNGFAQADFEANEWVIVEVVAESGAGNLKILVNGEELAVEPFGNAVLPNLVNVLLTIVFKEDLKLREYLLYETALAAGNRTSIRQNIATYYGITLS